MEAVLSRSRVDSWSLGYLVVNVVRRWCALYVECQYEREKGGDIGLTLECRSCVT